MNSTMNKVLIGALVGMGPQSTCPFYGRVMTEASIQYNAQYDMDFPNLLMYSLPTPFVVGQAIDEFLMKAQLSKGIQTLISAGVQLIAVPCNVVHLYYEHMQDEAGKVSVLNMVELAVNTIVSFSNKRIAILATEPTYASAIYQNHLLRKKIQPFVSSTLQAITNQLIRTIKAKSATSDAVRVQWDNLIEYLIANDCDTVLIACTDLSACVDIYPHPNIHFIDSMHALAQNFIAQMMQLTETWVD